MSSRRLLHALQPHRPFVCLQCAARSTPTRFLTTSAPRPKDESKSKTKAKSKTKEEADGASAEKKRVRGRRTRKNGEKPEPDKSPAKKARPVRIRRIEQGAKEDTSPLKQANGPLAGLEKGLSLKEALLGTKAKEKKTANRPNLPIEVLSPDGLHFTPVDHEIPPVPRLSYGLDRVLFNPGVYRLQDPRSRVYNFDPYLEKIMPVAEFDFDALGEYKTSSKDETLLAMTRRLKTKFTGSTSSMSGVLQHFHFALSNFRPLNHSMLSRKFPDPNPRFSKITTGPSAIFLRWKNGIYAVDADKSYDTPNIMSWLGHSLEKLLTTTRDEFERYRRSSTGPAPSEDDSGKCFHYSKLGNFLIRSQLDAQDERLPGTGIFDLKTRAVVSIRMNHQEYESGLGYQLRYDQGEWESFEREFYDMTRATMLKYSLQVRMGRMDGIFVAYHNIERMFGFQYMSLPDMDNVLHGQTDTCLGDQEFKLSVSLLDEILERATVKFPETTIRLHFEAHQTNPAYINIFAEPVTEEQADEIQNTKDDVRREFERTVIGIARDDPEVQAEWQDIQDRVDHDVTGHVDRDAQHTVQQDQVSVAEAKENSRDEKESTVSDETASADQVETDVEAPVERTPLVGWTLTVRNWVNGHYVDRPENLTENDDWKIEYHIKEIPEKAKWTQYQFLQNRRKALLGKAKEEQNRSLQAYRELIKRYSNKGRKWREEQDRIDEKIGRQVYRPLGPGAEKVLRHEAGLGHIADD